MRLVLAFAAIVFATPVFAQSALPPVRAATPSADPAAPLPTASVAEVVDALGRCAALHWTAFKMLEADHVPENAAIAKKAATMAQMAAVYMLRLQVTTVGGRLQSYTAYYPYVEDIVASSAERVNEVLQQEGVAGFYRESQRCSALEPLQQEAWRVMMGDDAR